MTISEVLKAGNFFRRKCHNFYFYIDSKGIVCSSYDRQPIFFTAVSLAANDWEVVSDTDQFNRPAKSHVTNLIPFKR